MAKKPYRAAKNAKMRKRLPVIQPQTPAKTLKSYAYRAGVVTLSAFFLTFLVFASMLITGFFMSESKDIARIFANAILKFQSIRTGIFIPAFAMLGIASIGALIKKMRWLWSALLCMTLIFTTMISAYVDYILYGQTKSAWVPTQIMDALYKESTPYRNRQNNLKPLNFEQKNLLINE